MSEQTAAKIEEVMPKLGEDVKPIEVKFRRMGDKKVSDEAAKRVRSGGAGFLTPNGPK